MNPTRLAHYDITERLGAGGMGEVYRARGSNGVFLVQNWIGDFARRASSPAPR